MLMYKFVVQKKFHILHFARDGVFCPILGRDPPSVLVAAAARVIPPLKRWEDSQSDIEKNLFGLTHLFMNKCTNS